MNARYKAGLLAVGLTSLAIGLIGFQVAVSALTEPSSQSGDSLLVQSRERLEVCVQGAAGFAVGSNADEHVARAIDLVRQHENWAQSGYEKGGGPSVAEGCQAEPYLLHPGVSFRDGVSVGELVIPRVDQPSKYRLYVFVVSPETLSTIIQGNLDVRRAPQEAVCSEGGLCNTVTTGVYVTAAELADAGRLSTILIEGLELVPPRAKVPDKEHQKKEGLVR